MSLLKYIPVVVRIKKEISMRIQKVVTDNGSLTTGNKQNDKTVDFPQVKQPVKDINLNYDPKAVAFKGLFSSSKKEEAPVVPKEPGIYGPYKLTPSQIKRNDEEVQYLVNGMCAIMMAENPNNKVGLTNAKNRANNATLGNMMQMCLSTLCYYQDSSTSFPQFYDSIVRAFPKACATADANNGNDNASRLYDRAMKRIEKLGTTVDPEGDDPIKAGIAYMYFTNDFPGFDLAPDEKSTSETIANMQLGRKPHMTKDFYYPRCHMSTVDDEINIYGNEYLKDRFGCVDHIHNTDKITNLSGCTRNMNFVKREEPEKIVIEEPIDIAAFVDEMLRGTF